LIDRITTVITFLILWIIIAQIALLLVARVYIKTGKMVWELIPSRKSPESLPEGTA
jgi:hypothetical protein